jgi:hypothetical protein
VKRIAALVAGVASVLLLAVPATQASVTRPTAPASVLGPFYICANGGSGLCLQTNGLNNSLVANDNNIQPPAVKQSWGLIQDGVTTATGPFNKSNLNSHGQPGQVAAGRKIYTLEDQYASILCAWQDTANSILVEMEGCQTTQGGDSYVASGSGRFINILASDSADQYVYLNSSGSNGGNPQLLIGVNSCPAACWGNVDH